MTAFGRSIDAIATDSDRLRVVKGDVTNAGDVAAAMPGQDAVICTFGAPLNTDTIRHQPDLCAVGARNILDAMEAEKVRRLICMTMIGADDSENVGRFFFRNVFEPLILGRIAKDREAQGELVAGSDADWTIVRPAELTDDAPVEDIRVLTDMKEGSAGTIARANVSRFLVRLLADDPWRGQRIVVSE